MRTNSDTVTIVGAGMAGAACASTLRDAGIPFRLVDRGRAVGGRMASPVLHGRRVDIGAGYFTVRDDEFAQLVERWETTGAARPWTDTFGVLAPGVSPSSSTGPTRWATPGGLRSLVRNVLDGIVCDTVDVDVLPAGDVVLAMPDPQANRLVAVPDSVGYNPAVTVVCGFDGAALPFVDAAFVNDHPVLEFLADDGARRGDGAHVLVAHTTASFALEHLDDPQAAIGPVIAAVTELLRTPAPSWTHAHRWTFAKPAAAHDATFGILTSGDGSSEGDFGSGTIYLAGDQWSPHGPPRVESAWRSGTDAGRAIVDAVRGRR